MFWRLQPLRINNLHPAFISRQPWLVSSSRHLPSIRKAALKRNSVGVACFHKALLPLAALERAALLESAEAVGRLAQLGQVDALEVGV